MDQSFGAKNCLDWCIKSAPTKNFKAIKPILSSFALLMQRQKKSILFINFFFPKILNKKIKIEQVVVLNILYNQQNINVNIFF